MNKTNINKGNNSACNPIMAPCHLLLRKLG